MSEEQIANALLGYDMAPVAPKKKRAVRRENDFYETAPWMVDALVDYLPELSGMVWMPCVGDGSLLRQLELRRPDLMIITNDIDPLRKADFHGDATNPLTWSAMYQAVGRWPEWVVDNPPFNVEIDILKCAYRCATKGVSFLSRISFVEPTKDEKPPSKKRPFGVRPRGPWLVEHPRAQQLALERYSFTGDGKSDSTTVEWLTWTKPGVEIANRGGYSAFGYKEGWAQKRREAA